jgi:hypothetical protein
MGGGGGKRHVPADLFPGMTQYPLYRRPGGPQGRTGRVRKISPSPGFDPQTVQPVASRYSINQKRDKERRLEIVTTVSVLKYVSVL